MKKNLYLAVSILSLLSISAHAQEIKNTNIEKDKLEEVIVTAQKRATNLQKTPISISVLSSKDLENRHIVSLADLATSGTPSLRIAPFFSRSSALTVGIRGMVPFDANQPSRDATVGVYLDGVYLGRSQGLGAALYDIQRIEVLKGPQGTLFGRNTEGGAVNIISKKPSGILAVSQTIGFGNYGASNIETHIDLPSIAGFSFKIDAVAKKRDGTVKNQLQSSEDFNQYDKRGIHLGILYNPNDKFSIRYDYDDAYDSTTPYYVQLIEANPAAPVPLSPLVKVQSKRAKETDIGLFQEKNLGYNLGHMLHADWKINDNLELRSISSWRKLKQDQRDNSIGAHSSPWRANGTFARYSMASLRQSQYSQELQIIGSLDEIKYVGGVYFYHEEGDDDAWTPNTAKWNSNATAYTYLQTLAAGAAWPFPDRASTAEATSKALFGQFVYTPKFLNEKAHLTLGLRYTQDEKEGLLYKVNGADVSYRFDISSEHTDPLINIAYDLNENVNMYLKWGTAYRAGGANSRSVSYRPFDAENVEATEFGFKSEFWNKKARFNFASYSTKYTDIQIDFSATNLNNSNRGTLETVNAPGEGKIEGIEADLSLNPVKGLYFGLNYAYTKGDLPKAANPFAGNALSNVFIVYTPENAISATIDYEKQTSFGRLIAHLDANYADGYHGSSSEDYLTDKSLVVNGRLAFSDISLNKDTKLKVSLWARNLLNEEHTFYESRGAYAFLGTFAMYNEPLTYGIDFNVKY